MDRPSTRRQWIELVGDGALITAALLSLFTGILLAISQWVPSASDSTWIQVLSALASLAGGLGGPLIVWLSHERRLDWRVLLGAVVGFPVAGAVFAVFTGIAWVMSKVLAPINDAEWFGPLVAAAALMVVLLGLIVWLLVDAVRDMRSAKPAHRRIDTQRLAGAAVIVVYSAAVIAIALTGSNGEIIEALAFMLLGAVSGASMVGSAELMVRLISLRTQASVQQ